MPTAPIWLHEGMAEFFSTVEASRWKAVVGKPVPGLTSVLRREPIIPTDLLFEVDSGTPIYQTPMFYAEAWLLTHILIDSPYHTSGTFDKFLSSLKMGMESRVGFIRAYGDSPGGRSKLSSGIT
jgi:hypothetical protein